MEELQSLDRDLLLALNGQHSPFWDAVMVFLSNKYVWIPFYLILIALLLYFYKRRGGLMILTLGASVGVADFVSSGILKPLVGRFRPCHDEVIGAYVHVVEGCGGSYGFVSSHAANSFAIALFLTLLLPSKQWGFKLVLLLWAAAISYSRVYLGVHYPGDITVGALIGCLAAWLGTKAYQQISHRYAFWNK